MPGTVSWIMLQKLGGVETGPMYVQYVQDILPNVPARAMFIELSTIWTYQRTS